MMKRIDKINIALIIGIVILTITAILGGILLYSMNQYRDSSIGFIENNEENTISTSAPAELFENNLRLPTITTKKINSELNETLYNVDSDYLSQIYSKDKLEENTINILLIGMDARPGWMKSRSDTMIIASYNKETNDIKLTSIMRDCLVDIPGYGWDRINAATVYGGPGLLINTINSNFGTDIQDYVLIRFEGFREVIDIIGGVELELTESEVNYINSKQHSDDGIYNNDLSWHEGLITLNGGQALWHCRNRSLGNSDFSRVDRQKDTLISIFESAKKNIGIAEMFNLLVSMYDYVDTNMSIQDMYSLGMTVLKFGNIKIGENRIPADDSWSYANVRGMSVLNLDMEKNREALLDYIYGSGYTDMLYGDEVGDALSDSEYTDISISEHMIAERYPDYIKHDDKLYTSDGYRITPDGYIDMNKDNMLEGIIEYEESEG